MELNQSQKTDLKIVYESFCQEPKTMKEVFKDTGVIRESICRHCSTLRDIGKLFNVGKRRCSVTKRIVKIWSTNPSEAMLNTDQLDLFN
jgi:hypothetical protein